MFQRKAKRTTDTEEAPPFAVPASEPAPRMGDIFEGSVYQARTGDVQWSAQAIDGAVRLHVSNGAINPDLADAVAAGLTSAAAEARLQAPPIEPPPIEPNPG